MTELICIVCPKGCHLKVDEENAYAVTGNSCEKGAAYGKKELTNPTRVVTSTVRVEGGEKRRVSVKTSSDIPKSKMLEAVSLLNAVTLTAPVHIGDLVLKNILDTGADFVATGTVEKE